jgi:hypothetical protein
VTPQLATADAPPAPQVVSPGPAVRPVPLADRATASTPTVPSANPAQAHAPASAFAPAATFQPAVEPRPRHAAPTPDGGRSWRAASLGSLTYCLFAVQQPGPLAELRTREQVLDTPAPAPPAGGVREADPFLRRQNVLGEVSLLDL